jgi:hypothetical protein
MIAGLAHGGDVPATGTSPATVWREPVRPNDSPKAPVSVPAGQETATEEDHPVTAGDGSLSEQLWQRTWGQAGIYGFPTGQKMAPNGVVYDPLFTLDLMLNIALTTDRSWYLFTDAAFWAEKAEKGVTNPKQGQFDFSKRQFDLNGGVAWNYTGPWEARAFVFSRNNLNRGQTVDMPFGYNDGFALENRYYLPGTSFDKGLYRYLSAGYYVTKTMTGADGKPFNPSLFARANLALDLVPDCLYLYSDTTFLTRRAVTAKFVLEDAGVAWRPFPKIPDLELRIGVNNTYDMQDGNLRALLYGNVRIIW